MAIRGLISVYFCLDERSVGNYLCTYCVAVQIEFSFKMVDQIILDKKHQTACSARFLLVCNLACFLAIQHVLQLVDCFSIEPLLLADTYCISKLTLFKHK